MLRKMESAGASAAQMQKKHKKIGLSRRELNPGLERIELMFKLDKLTY